MRHSWGGTGEANQDNNTGGVTLNTKHGRQLTSKLKQETSKQRNSDTTETLIRGNDRGKHKRKTYILNSNSETETKHLY